MDADRQWFKSRQGLDAEETPRDLSFCGHAILDDKIMVVNDAEQDQRFCDNPLVCGDPSIRFYAGYPLAAPDGSRVGTLCVIDDKPKDISKEQLQLLSELGRMVEEELIAANDTTIDPITKISNRNGFLAIADHLLSLCKRKSEPSTLMMFHLEDLHSLEERHGRYEGDTAAVELAHLLATSVRESDIVARLSADVFGVLLPSTDLDGAEEARRLFDKQLGKRNLDPSRQHDDACRSFYCSVRRRQARRCGITTAGWRGSNCRGSRATGRRTRRSHWSAFSVCRRFNLGTFRYSQSTP